MITPAVQVGDRAGGGLARIAAAHQEAANFYRDHLLRADGPRRYLNSRGLGVLTRSDRESQIDSGAPWRLGYAPPGWTNLVDHLTAAGYNPAELITAGLATRSRTGATVDLFRDRIMFPIHAADGRPVAFIGRAAPTAGVDVPKYLNTPETVAYHKGQTLYGRGEQTDQIAAGAAPIAVEGPMDVLAVWLAHPDADRIAIAACGTGFNAHHAAVVTAMPGAVRQGVTVAQSHRTRLAAPLHPSRHRAIRGSAARRHRPRRPHHQ